MEAMEKTDYEQDDFFNEFVKDVNVFKIDDGGIVLTAGFDPHTIRDHDLKKTWDTLVPNMCAEFCCWLDQDNCTMTLTTDVFCDSLIIKKARVALYLMARKGVPAREALIIMDDWMHFDLIKVKKPDAISQEDFHERYKLFLEDDATLEDYTLLVFAPSIQGIQSVKDVMEYCIERKETPKALVKILKSFNDQKNVENSEVCTYYNSCGGRILIHFHLRFLLLSKSLLVYPILLSLVL